METTEFEHQTPVYTVSRLTTEIKTLLEEKFPFVWVTGEISNFRVPVSGHFYFALKDKQAQIQAVMFRGQNQMLKFIPEDGMQVTGLGRIGVYEPRGAYQIIFEYLEPKGVGALQVAFAKLKARLAQEGLFDTEHKRSIPFLPRKIGIVTSPTGAAIHDILNILNRRFPSIPVVIFPVTVQGADAVTEIERALDELNRLNDTDVIIVARGGGSLEDLQTFNSETVARAVFRSAIPVISAVGHETDYTIIDFVADLRAPTPSAAAELVVPLRDELLRRYIEQTLDLKATFHDYIERHRKELDNFRKRLTDPRKTAQNLKIRVDDYAERIARAFKNAMKSDKKYLDWQIQNLFVHSPLKAIEKNQLILKQNHSNLLLSIKKTLNQQSAFLEALFSKMHALSPQAVLDRGYSITQTIPENEIIKDSAGVERNQKVKTILSKGYLYSIVEDKN